MFSITVRVEMAESALNFMSHDFHSTLDNFVLVKLYHLNNDAVNGSLHVTRLYVE